MARNEKQTWTKNSAATLHNSKTTKGAIFRIRGTFVSQKEMQENIFARIRIFFRKTERGNQLKQLFLPHQNACERSLNLGLGCIT